MLAALFDLDGTLADTIGSILSAVNMTMRHFGLPDSTYGAVRLALGNGTRQLIKKLLPADYAEDVSRLDDAVKYYDKCYIKTYTEADHCYPGVSEAVHELAKRGMKIAILSNKPHDYVVGLAKILFPDGIVSIAQGQTDLPIKPHPAVPLDIAARLGVKPSECFFVGDTEVDIATAKNAGMVSVGCSWGYRDRSVLVDSKADHIVDNADEMLAVMTR